MSLQEEYTPSREELLTTFGGQIELINRYIQQLPSPIRGAVSDGFHTFDELYKHRIALYMALAKRLEVEDDRSSRGPYYNVWRSHNHSDGKPAFGGGWFVLGIGRQAGEQITYHLPEEYWDKCDFALSVDKAPEFDGHSSDDVLQRLYNLL